MFYCDQKVYLYHAMHTYSVLSTHSAAGVNNFPKIENNIWCCYSVILYQPPVNIMARLSICVHIYLQYGGSR